MAEPFLSFYTPTYRRPTQLAACLDSVRRQTHANVCEQIVIPDHVGIGVGGMYAQVARYAQALHGEYVHFLCDDDVLAHDRAVEALRLVVEAERDAVGNGPDVVIVGSQKPGGMFPVANQGPPVLGGIDLGCFVIQRQLWIDTCDLYGRRYEGDYDYIAKLWELSQPEEPLPPSEPPPRGGQGGLRWSWHKELHFVTGQASRGRYEGQWP